MFAKTRVVCEEIDKVGGVHARSGGALADEVAVAEVVGTQGFFFTTEGVEDEASELASDGLGEEAGKVKVAVRIGFAFLVGTSFGAPGGVERFV